VIDHWWQTESGWPMLANLTGVELLPVKPGSAGVPVPGYDIRCLREDGTEAEHNESGMIAIRLPLPPGNLLTLWNNPKRFMDAYFARFKGYFNSGDAGYIDEDGYVFITGRIDDIINVAGHRLSTGEMEEVVARHPAVAECAVFGVSDELKGEIPICVVVLKAHVEIATETLQAEIVQSVRKTIGPVASLKKVFVVKRLPKTRSGKILRKTMRKIADGKEYRVPSTIDDPAILEEITEALFETEATL
jgi:acyl-coenzyme A synthetase/AMP-(fatty) acid ligase